MFYLRTWFLCRANLAVENLALRQQLAVLKKSVKRPKLHPRDRFFWAWLSRLWPDWKSALVLVKPETVIGWHRQGFKLFWKWKSKNGKPGRPAIGREVRDLIRSISIENPTWGSPRIQSELLLLGHEISEKSVAKYMVSSRKPPSQTWKTFLENHMANIVACDFLTVPTATFRVLYVFVILSHDRRKIVHFNVTSNPSAMWAAQQVVDAFPFDDAPRYLIRDRDGIYGDDF